MSLNLLVPKSLLSHFLVKKFANSTDGDNGLLRTIIRSYRYFTPVGVILYDTYKIVAGRNLDNTATQHMGSIDRFALPYSLNHR